MKKKSKIFKDNVEILYFYMHGYTDSSSLHF